MSERDPTALLADYVRHGSESAFRELVDRYVDLVYATALRRVGGDAHLARDVVQLTFIDLARKARWLPAGVRLGGWLHHHTCYRARTLIRGEVRRRLREHKAAEMNALDQTPSPAWERIAPLLDDALESLSSRDRDAIVLRFFEEQNLAEVGRAFGISEDAAQKVVGRALEKLREHFARRGIAASTTLIAGTLGATASHATPAGLVSSTTQVALAAASRSWVAPATQEILSGIRRHKLAFSGAAAVTALVFLLSGQRGHAKLQTAPVRTQTGSVAPAVVAPPAAAVVESTVTTTATPVADAAPPAVSPPPPAAPVLAPLGDTPTSPEVLAHMLKAYRDCRSYFDTGLVTKLVGLEGRQYTKELYFTTAYLRPDQLRFEFTHHHGRKTPEDSEYRFIAWANGSEVRAWWDLWQPHERAATLWDAMTGAAVLSTLSLQLVPFMIWPDDRRPGYRLENFMPNRPLESGEIEGVNCYVIRGTLVARAMTLWIEKDTLMLKQTVLEDSAGLVSRVTTVYHPVVNGHVPKELLRYDPPKR